MIVIGLTGSIGMGKSTLARQLSQLGAKVSNADTIVHHLLAQHGGAVAAVGEHFPGVVKNGAVDRKALGKIVFGDAEKRRLLESILHPLVVAREIAFIKKHERMGAKFVVLDIPLLFETRADERCDITICVTAPPLVQRQRVMSRSGMTEEKFKQILVSQMPHREKQNRADIVIYTGLGKAYSFKMAKHIIHHLSGHK